jgi:hypothetical protein
MRIDLASASAVGVSAGFPGRQSPRGSSVPPTSALSPIAGLDWLDIKDNASPADIFRAIGKLRKDARDKIQRLVPFLDEPDNHMELEPNGDALGFP